MTFYSVAHGKTKICKAQHVVETNQELAAVLFTKRDKTLKDEANRESDEVRRRKLARMQAVRARDGAENQNIMVWMIIGSFYGVTTASENHGECSL